MRPTANMDLTPAKALTPTVLGYTAGRCELCLENGGTRTGTRFLWMLGHPAMKVCLPCAREMKKVWEGALDA